jgi:hypothetical protein
MAKRNAARWAGAGSLSVEDVHTRLVVLVNTCVARSAKRQRPERTINAQREDRHSMARLRLSSLGRGSDGEPDPMRRQADDAMHLRIVASSGWCV